MTNELPTISISTLILSFPPATKMFQFAGSSLTSLCIQLAVSALHTEGFTHSEISGSELAYQLPEAYRRLLRPSSSFDVKASTIYP